MDKIKQMLQNVIDKLNKKINIEDYKEYFDYTYMKEPNGYLDDLSLFVIDTSYQHDNDVTEYKSYLKETFNDNMFINKYTLSITVQVYGPEFLQQLNDLEEKSKERIPVVFIYTKLNKVFAPLCITSFSYDENSEFQERLEVKFSFKEVQLLEFVTKDGITTTNVYNPLGQVQKNVELDPVILNETMKDKYKSDVRTGGINV